MRTATMRMSRAAVMVSLGISEKGHEKKRTMYFDYRLKGGAGARDFIEAAGGIHRWSRCCWYHYPSSRAHHARPDEGRGIRADKNCNVTRTRKQSIPRLK